MNVASFYPGFQSKRSHPTRAARAGTPVWAGISQRFQRYSSPAPRPSLKSRIATSKILDPCLRLQIVTSKICLFLCRQWATRSYAIALVFIAGRFVLGVTGWEALGVEIVQAIIWACLALSVVLADVAIHWKEIRSAVTVPVRSSVSTATANSGVSRKPNVSPLQMGEG